MTPKYKVGDFVYVARAGRKEFYKTCDVCFGKKQVVVTLGNDDRVTIPCSYCGAGFADPAGKIRDCEWGVEVKLEKITQVRVSQTDIEEKIEYQSESWCLHEENIFDTREEADARCIAIFEEHKREQETRSDLIKKDKMKSFAWNAGYHLRAVKDAQKQIEYHSRMAVLCKARAKT